MGMLAFGFWLLAFGFWLLIYRHLQKSGNYSELPFL